MRDTQSKINYSIFTVLSELFLIFFIQPHKTGDKSLIIGVVEVVTHKTKTGKIQEKAGRIRLQKISAASEKEIKNFLNQNVAHGSIIKSDGRASYSCFVRWDTQANFSSQIAQ